MFPGGPWDMRSQETAAPWSTRGGRVSKTVSWGHQRETDTVKWGVDRFTLGGGGGGVLIGSPPPIYLLSWSTNKKENLTGLRLSKWWQNFHSWMNYSYSLYFNNLTCHNRWYCKHFSSHQTKSVCDGPVTSLGLSFSFCCFCEHSNW